MRQERIILVIPVKDLKISKFLVIDNAYQFETENKRTCVALAKIVSKEKAKELTALGYKLKNLRFIQFAGFYIADTIIVQWNAKMEKEIIFI